MKVGDYVRTKKHGIGKIISFSYQEDDECCFIELSKRRTGIKQSNIIKSSPNIIDLIEVGDYVDKLRVVDKDENYIVVETFDERIFIYKEDTIKSIVTKEMFSSAEYRVEND